MNAKTRRDQAQAILANPVLKEAMEGLEAYYTAQMVATERDDTEGRNKWHSCIHTLNDVKVQLETFIAEGKLQEENERKKEKEENGS